MLTENEINKEISAWNTILSKYIISRSSRFLSEQTQKDARTLMMCSLINILLCLGIATIDQLSIEDLKIKSTVLYFAPFVFELVCVYYAIGFMADQRSDVKAWQFKSTIEDADEYNPLERIKNYRRQLDSRRDSNLETHEKAIEALNRKYKQESIADQSSELSSRQRIHLAIAQENDQYEEFESHTTAIDILNLELKAKNDELNIEEELWKFKVKSFQELIPPINKSYKLKYALNITFPLLLFFLSILSLFYYLIRRN